ncbi:MAG: vWA domain-containing protein [Candidatus Krumholzibacteriia bacterium]
MIARMNALKCRARADHRFVHPAGGARHLLIELKAPAVERPDAAARPPLNVAIVIDASGSMAGEPLDAARRAAIGIIEALSARDRITVVSFADDILTHAAGLPADARGRRAAIAAVRALHPRGCTDLCGGWQRGCELAAELAATLESPSSRVILLSDGHANRGITDPATLESLANHWRERGVYTSTVGIGEGYSAVQLRALASRGGGRMHHAARPEEIIEVVVGELGQILLTAADDVRVTITTPAAATATPLGPWPIEIEHVPTNGATRTTLLCGTLTSAQERSLAVRLDLPETEPGCRLPITVTATWTPPGETARLSTPTLDLEFESDARRALSTEWRDTEVADQIARLWLTHLLLHATGHLEQGDRDQAYRTLAERTHQFRTYCTGLPNEDDLARDFAQHDDTLHACHSQADAKELHVSSMKTMLRDRDLRAGYPPPRPRRAARSKA